MGSRFSKRIKIAPGVRVNVGLRGLTSVSVGGRGASVNFGKRGVHANVGTPISGLSYRTKIAGAATSSQRLSKAEKDAMLREWDGVELSLSLDEKGLVVFNDCDGNPAPGPVAKELVKTRLDAINAWLERTASQINAGPSVVAGIHLKTPRNAVQFTAIPFQERPPLRASVPEPDLTPDLLGSWTRVFHLLWPPAKSAWLAAQEAEADRKQAAFCAAQAEAERLHDAALAAWEGRRSAHETAEEARRAQWDKREQDSGVMEQLLETTLQAISWPRETLVEFEVRAPLLLMDVDLPEVEDMPATEAAVRAGGKGLKYKKRPVTTVRKEYMRHIHEIALRLCGEAFALLPGVETIVLSGYSQRLDKATGHINDDYLYSFRVNRAQWSAIDLTALERVDPVEAIGAWEHRRKVSKTGIFKPIEPFAS